MTSIDSAPSSDPIPSLKETLMDLFKVSAEDADLLFSDPHTLGVIKNNFSIPNDEAPNGKLDLDESEFIQERLKVLKSLAAGDNVTTAEIRRNMVEHGPGRLELDNN